MVKSLRFRKVDNKFKRTLAKDLKGIRSSKKNLTAADKTSDMYRLSKDQYSNLLQNAITSKYKKTDKRTATNINKEGIKHAREVNVIDRIEINGTGSSFITLKDHKENFLNRPTTRLLNPAKNEIGRISKHILQNINKTLSEEIKVNEWKNTESVINWFKNIPNKHLYKFLMFDIKDFYPSIKEKLLWEAIRFAKLYISTTNKDIEAIFHARKFLLYYNDEPWVKNGESNFDVSIGSYDGAQAYALIGIFMLSLLSKYINKNRFGLHKDDGLAILKNTSSLEAEKLNKKYQKLFKEIELDIIIQCNLKITIYLDITLNLNDGSYRPYRKPDEETSYIHINSDHPPSIIKEIPQSIEKRLSILPSSKDIFQESPFTMKNA